MRAHFCTPVRVQKWALSHSGFQITASGRPRALPLEASHSSRFRCAGASSYTSRNGRVCPRQAHIPLGCPATIITVPIYPRQKIAVLEPLLYFNQINALQPSPPRATAHCSGENLLWYRGVSIWHGSYPCHFWSASAVNYASLRRRPQLLAAVFSYSTKDDSG